MSKGWSLGVTAGVLFVSSLVVSLSPRAAVEPFRLPELARIAGLVLHSEVADTPPPELLTAAQAAAVRVAHTGAAPFREAHIVSVRCLPGSTAQERPALEVWSLNAAPVSHTLFNRFQVKLSDGGRVQDAAGREVGPGQWLHVLYQLPAAADDSDGVEYQVELIEPGVLTDYIHDSAQGQASLVKSE